MIAVLLTAMIAVAKNAGGLKEIPEVLVDQLKKAIEGQVGSARLPATYDEPEYG